MSADTSAAAPARIRRSVRSHRIPGICLSLLGFLILFAAIMMLAMGQTIHSNNYKSLRIGGGITLVIGIAIVSAGFAYQYVRHRDWKRRQLARQQRRHQAASEDIIISSRAQMYVDGELPCTSGSMINLGIEDEGAQWHYDPYAGAVVRDDDAQYRENFEQVESNYNTDSNAASHNKPKYDIFTVTPSPDVIVVHNEQEELRSRSLSPSIICHHVIDDLSDSDDDQPAEPTITPATELDANQLVNKLYSPKLTKRSLMDIGSQIEHEQVEALKQQSRSPSPFQQSSDSPRPSSGVSSSLYSDESSIDLPVIKRKQRRKAPLKATKSPEISHETTPRENNTSPLVSAAMTPTDSGANGTAKKSPRSGTQDFANGYSPTHSPKGKATQGSCIKSSKNITGNKQRQLERSTSNETDLQQNVLNDKQRERNFKNAKYTGKNSSNGTRFELNGNGPTIESNTNYDNHLERNASREESDWDSDSLGGELNHSLSDSNTNAVNGTPSLGEGHKRAPPLAHTVAKRAPALTPAVSKHVRHLPPTGSYTDDHDSGSDWDSDLSVRDMIQPQRSLDTCDSRCS